MPALSIPNTFIPFTKIVSAQMNANFTAITTLLNTTKLDDDNLQALGISLSKLKQSSATTGQVPVWNGSAWQAASVGLAAVYNYILGSSADVTAGVATNTTFAGITQADGDRILILPGYATTENWTVTKQISVMGGGYGSRINGTVTFSSAADRCMFKNMRISDTVTLQAGADQVWIECFLDSGKSFSIDDSVTGEYVLGLQAT